VPQNKLIWTGSPWSAPWLTVSATVPASVTNYQPTGMSPNTGCLALLAAAGGSTINSLAALAYPSLTAILNKNTSTTDPLIFPHLGSGAVANQFSNVNGGSVQIEPLGAAFCHRVLGQWSFA
jgi:hypothetical protein